MATKLTLRSARVPRRDSVVIALAVWVAVISSSLAQTTFTKITTGPMVTDGADGEGCAWVDFDNDGDLDLYVSCDQTGMNLLYRNDGNGMFTRITTGPLVNAGAGSVSASWVDFDNDGRLDLFVSRQDGRPGLLFHQQADGAFTRSALPLGGFSWGSAWADYDNDGFVDLLVGDTTRDILWRNDGQGGLIAVTNTPIVTTPKGLNITWVDYNSDGYMDAFLGNTARLYRNDGQGNFTPSEQFPFGSGAAWGDYDNDRFPDLFLPRLNSQTSLLFHNEGDGTFAQVLQSPFSSDTGFSVSGIWADYDNDGWLDLFVTNFGNGGKNRLYHNHGDGTFTRVLTGTIANDLGNSAGAAWGDYDRDGFVDLFVANGTNERGERNDFLYHNDGNSNAWLTIKLAGTVSNRSAIGAKVRLKAAINGQTFWQFREINSGNGWSQNALEAHFGLGNATNAEVLRIEWPSGTVQEFPNVAARQFLIVTEPSRPLAASSNRAGQITLKGGRAMRYEIETSTNLMAWSLLGAITITNPDGTAVITDTNSPASDRRFYRARLAPP